MYLNKLRFLILSIALGAVSGCISAPDQPEFQIVEQKLHTKTENSGAQLFVYIVTVEATPHVKVNANKPMSRSELRKFAEFQRVEDSPELKLQLEERAVALLKDELAAKSYCQSGYEIEQVYWRQRSVQLRGTCL